MRRLFRSMTYKTKLSLAMIGFMLVPALLFTGLYLKTSVEQRHAEKLRGYGEDVRKSVAAMRELTSISVQKFNSLDRNAQLQMFLKYPDNVDLSGKIDLFYNLNSLYLALCISSEMRDMKIYARNLKDESLSFIVAFDQLAPEIRNAVLDRKAGDILFRYAGSDDDRLACRGDLALYKTNIGLDGQIVAVQQIVLGFPNFRKLFDFEKLPPQSIVLYDIEGQRPVVISDGGVGAGAVGRAFAGYTSGGSYGDFEVMAYDMGYRSGTPAAGQGGRNDRVLVFIPLGPMRGESARYILTAALIMLAAVLCIVFVVWAVSRKLTNRLYFLIRSINTEIGSLEKRDKDAIIFGDDEFQQINASFHELIGKIKESYRSNAHVEAEKRLLEAELMQEMINPHFLYNTLESIKWAGDNRQTAAIIDSMVKYYRITLNKGNQLLPVGQELKLVEEYIKLQKFAYESDFRYSIACSARASELMIPKHLLQPIVENSILHGIDKKGEAGSIDITCDMDDRWLRFRIADNGSGMGEAKLAALRDGLARGEAGFGLRNVQKRLLLYYGESSSLSIQSAEGAGTVAEIRIPAEAVEKAG